MGKGSRYESATRSSMYGFVDNTSSKNDEDDDDDYKLTVSTKQIHTTAMITFCSECSAFKVVPRFWDDGGQLLACLKLKRQLLSSNIPADCPKIKPMSTS